MNNPLKEIETYFKISTEGKTVGPNNLTDELFQTLN